MDDFSFVEIDRCFARFLGRITGCSSPERLIAAALVSAAGRSGHVCLDLADVAGESVPHEGPDGGEMQIAPPLPGWIDSLRGWEAVGKPGENYPLLLDDFNRLYLHRYWRYEDAVARFLCQRDSGRTPSATSGSLAAALDRYFPPSVDGAPDLQREAAAAAATGRVTLITGGPGTGKTSTVVKILALLIEQAGVASIDVALAAPTGKAAARLKEAVEAARDRLDCESWVRDRVPSGASTIHRMLGARPGGASFRHGPDNPLPHDVVVVDEASMIDLPLMSRLVSALAPQARLVLLGDRDQLASVEPGAVFGDICESAGSSRMTATVVPLRKSWRFREDSGIGAVSRLVNEGKGGDALAIIDAGRHADIGFRDLGEDPSVLESAILSGYAGYLDRDSIPDAFEAFNRFRILCPFRSGPYGVEAVNRFAERVLDRAGLIRPRGGHYKGRPIMVTRNDYRARLFNGDVGILYPNPGAGDALYAWFQSDDGSFRAVSTARLPEHETVYAMTVHKSQGSEFDQVLLLLGSTPSDHLTRESLYTGITRGRSRVDIVGSRDVFRAAAERRVERRSGLADALRGGNGPP